VTTCLENGEKLGEFYSCQGNVGDGSQIRKCHGRILSGKIVQKLFEKLHQRCLIVEDGSCKPVGLAVVGFAGPMLSYSKQCSFECRCHNIVRNCPSICVTDSSQVRVNFV